MSSFNKEELIAEVNYNLEHCYCSEKTKRLMEIALASLEAEPVAWRCDSGSIANRRVVTVSKVVADSWGEKGMKVSPLYAAPPEPLSVPDEVTTEDCPAFVKYDVTGVDEAWSRGWNGCRVAMLREVK